MIKANFLSYFNINNKNYLAIGFYDPFVNKKVAV